MPMTRNTAPALPRLLLLMLLSGLAACASPLERCVSRNTSEYRAVARLLAEVEGNLARGYAWQQREITMTQWEDCPMVVGHRDGGRHVVYRPCPREVSHVERYRVAIDPAAEMRKRDYLRARKQQLAGPAVRAVAACRAAYPEQSAPRP
mgnify:CR=1 FL=1